MNAYKLNSKSNYYIRSLICKHFNIGFSEVYRQIKSIEVKEDIIVETKDFGKYKLMLERYE